MKPLSGGSRNPEKAALSFQLGRDTKDRKKFSSRTARPKESFTRFRVLQRFEKTAAQLELIPGTGRTHQLRVHLTAIGCPILGDQTYGGKKVMSVGTVLIPRVMLHAKKLGFIHPEHKNEMEFTAPLPSDMKGIVEALKKITFSGEDDQMIPSGPLDRRATLFKKISGINMSKERNRKKSVVQRMAFKC